MTKLESNQITHFYRAAAAGLAGLERRGVGTRRFNAEAHSRWQAFKGEMQEADRLDLALRDAGARHPMAFAPREVFSLEGLAPDEPFGPDWAGAGLQLALELVKRLRTEEHPEPEAALREAAAAWDLNPERPELPAGITPATKIIAAGAGAVIALALHFLTQNELDLTDQVVLVTARPGERQVFGIAAALLDCREPARCLTPSTPADMSGLRRLDMAAVSSDAQPDARQAAEHLLDALSAR